MCRCIIEPGEWTQLEAGLIQRAELLEAVLADSYGPATLTGEGRLPAALIAGNPEFLRPLVGVAPPGGAHLRFYAVDVGRGADGRWWVLNDRAQAPSGAGYAIENRLALSRAIPDIYRTARVERVAPFFQAFQAELVVAQSPGRCAHLPADAGTDERDLFRARLSGALSRPAPGRRRGPHRARRRRLHPHRVGAAPHRGDPAAGSMPTSPIRWSSTPRRASASPACCKRCATARSSSSIRSAPAWSRRAPCWRSCRRWRRPCSAPS